MILVRLRGCAGLDDSWQKFPDDSIHLRQSATAAQCSIDRRRRSVPQAGRLPPFATGSPQLSLEDVGEIADQFVALDEHELATGMAARFHADMMAFPADKRKEELLKRSKPWAKGVAVIGTTCVEVENIHGANRRRAAAGGQTVEVATLGGMAMASQLRTDMLSTQIAAGAIQDSDSKHQKVIADLDEHATLLRKETAESLHRKEWFARQRTLGSSRQVHNSMGEVKSDFGKLSPDDMNEYIRRANLLSNRKQVLLPVQDGCGTPSGPRNNPWQPSESPMWLPLPQHSRKR